MKNSSNGSCGSVASSVETSGMKLSGALGGGHVAVDPPRLHDRVQIVAADLLQHGVGHLEGGVDAGDAQRSAERRHVPHEGGEASSSGGLPMKSATSSVKKSLAARKPSTVLTPMWSAST